MQRGRNNTVWDFREEFIEEVAFGLKLEGCAGILLGGEGDDTFFKE